MRRYNLSDVEADNQYIDILISNVNATQTPPVPVSFVETRSTPIIQNASHYQISIVRASIDTQLLPTFIPLIQPNQGDPNLTVYSVSLTYTDRTGAPIDYTQQTFLEWVPQDGSYPEPSPPSAQVNGYQVSSPYYYAYNFQFLAFLVYKALLQCFDDLKAQVVSGALDAVEPPIFTWLPQPQLAEFLVDQQYYQTFSSFNPLTVNPNAILIYMNNPLFALFSSFPFKFNGIDVPNGLNNLIICNNFSGTNLVSVPNIGTPNYTALSVQQEYSTVSNITPVSSIVFCSNAIPIVSTQITAPVLYYDNILIQTGSNSAFGIVLTDIETSDNGFKPSLLYQPSTIRYISLTGNQPVKTLDISVFWKNRKGELIPLYLVSNGSCSIKILLEKIDEAK